MMVCATHPDDFEAVLTLAGGPSAPAVTVSLGVHPYRAADAEGGGTEGAAWLKELSARLADADAATGVVAGVGECGMDRSPRGLALCPEDVQVAVFSAQARLAAATGRPLTVHCVRAAGAVAAVLRAEGPFRGGVVLHGWTGKAAALGQLLALGCSASFSPAVLRPAFRGARESAAACPDDRLLAETDSPDQPLAEGLGEPADVARVLLEIASLRKQRHAHTAELTAANFSKLFCRPVRRGECASE